MSDFSLIETLRWDPEVGFTRLRLHIARLERSARRIGFPAPRAPAEALQEAVHDAAAPLRVRLTFDANGRIEVTSAPFVPLAPDTIWKVKLAAQRLDSSDKLLRIRRPAARSMRRRVRNMQPMTPTKC